MHLYNEQFLVMFGNPELVLVSSFFFFFFRFLLVILSLILTVLSTVDAEDMNFEVILHIPILVVVSL